MTKVEQAVAQHHPISTPAGDVAVSVRGLTKRFGSVTAVDDVSFDIEAGKIYGLLGRNGAGKTTVMQMLTAQTPATSGTVDIFGAPPWENPAALARICFIKESQRYPDDFRVRHVLSAASAVLPHWDDEYARRLVDDFELPPSRKVKKLSRGMTSALGIVVGLAARAPITFFDEPYLGLDAVARQRFYDLLLADYADRPRTIVLSTHLVDEVSDLLEHVLMIDRGRVLVDADTDDLRNSAYVISGRAENVERVVDGKKVLHRESLGSTVRVSIRSALSPTEQDAARALGLSIDGLSLQQLLVRSTTGYADKEFTA